MGPVVFTTSIPVSQTRFRQAQWPVLADRPVGISLSAQRHSGRSERDHRQPDLWFRPDHDDGAFGRLGQQQRFRRYLDPYRLVHRCQRHHLPGRRRHRPLLYRHGRAGQFALGPLEGCGQWPAHVLTEIQRSDDPGALDYGRGGAYGRSHLRDGQFADRCHIHPVVQRHGP